MKILEGLGVTAIIFYLALILAMFAGWVSNICWLFSHLSAITPQWAVSLVGIFLFPLGAFHGIFTWF